jgi:hypothetical protein
MVRVISHNAQYGTRFEGFGKCSIGLMEPRAGYSVKTAPEQASAGARILANAWRGRGRDEQNYPASPRLDEEHQGADAPDPSQEIIAASAPSYLRNVALCGRGPVQPFSIFEWRRSQNFLNSASSFGEVVIRAMMIGGSQVSNVGLQFMTHTSRGTSAVECAPRLFKDCCLIVNNDAGLKRPERLENLPSNPTKCGASFRFWRRGRVEAGKQIALFLRVLNYKAASQPFRVTFKPRPGYPRSFKIRPRHLCHLYWICRLQDWLWR